MEKFINLQNILLDPKKGYEEFEAGIKSSQISQFTYICLLLNTAVTIKRQNFNFQPYMNLLVNYKKEEGQGNERIKACLNYSGYKDSISILMNACEKSNFATVKTLVSHPLVNLHQTDPNGMSAIFYTLKNQDQMEGFRMFEFMHDQDSELIHRHNYQNPIIFYAIQRFKVRFVQLLLKVGENPNQRKEDNGNTALHELIKISSKHHLSDVKIVIQLFLLNGFDLGIKNYEGQTVEEYAFEWRFNLTEVIQDIVEGRYLKANSEFGKCSQSNETDLSSKRDKATAKTDIVTFEGCSENFSSELYQDNLSSSNQSLFSECQFASNQRQAVGKQLSECMNLDYLIEPIDSGKDFPKLKPSSREEKPSKSHQHSRSHSAKSHSSSHSKKSLLSSNSQYHENRIQSSFYSISDHSSSSQSLGNQFIASEYIDFLQIENEILEFDQASWKIYISAWEEIQGFFSKLSTIVQPLGLKVEIIGSFATGLWTHYSDIDIALVVTSDTYVEFDKLIEKVYKTIRKNLLKLNIKQISFNKSAKMQSIKIDMDPVLFGKRKIDIMIFHQKNNARAYVNYISEAIFAYKQIRPLFFTLKRICEEFGFHDPLNGGLKSYSIFLMIYSLVCTMSYSNLGEFLEKMASYYGFHHQFDYETQQTMSATGNRSEESQYFQLEATMRLNLHDPLNPKNNMGGKNTNAGRVKDMFRAIYYGIHKKRKQIRIDSQNESQSSENGQGVLQYILDMAKII